MEEVDTGLLAIWAVAGVLACVFAGLLSALENRKQRLDKEAADKYAAFSARVTIRNPDRVRHVYDVLSDTGRDSIQTQENFIQDEQSILLGTRKTKY